MHIKFCGFTREEDLEAAAALGIWAAGFVFHPGSKRYIPPERAASLATILSGTGIMRVGVFVKPYIDFIKSTRDLVGLDYLQLYDGTAVAQLKDYCPIIAAYRIKEKSELKFIENDICPKITQIKNQASNDLILLDSFHPDLYGGSGKAMNWGDLKDFPYLDKTIIAGGINEGNVKSLLNTIRPYGIDISSGIEDSPGRKSAEKMRTMINRINEVIQ